MIKVKRSEVPQSLKKNYEKWTKKLLEQIAKNKGYKNVKDCYKTKYKQEDVRKALVDMYRSCCCYCEGLLGTQSYGQIEHLRPKSIFPELTYEWENLHWSCEICNGKKNDQWDNDFPILDPTVDDIDKFMQYNTRTGEYDAVDNNRRALFTINAVALNRQTLCQKRQRIRIKVVNIFVMMRKNRIAVSWDEFYKIYKEYYDIDEYFSVYEAIFNELRQMCEESYRG